MTMIGGCMYAMGVACAYVFSCWGLIVKTLLKHAVVAN